MTEKQGAEAAADCYGKPSDVSKPLRMPPTSIAIAAAGAASILLGAAQDDGFRSVLLGGAGSMTLATGFRHGASLLLEKLSSVVDGLLPNFLMPYFERSEYRSFLENSDIQRNVAAAIAEVVRSHASTAVSRELAASIEAKWLSSLTTLLKAVELNTDRVRDSIRAAHGEPGSQRRLSSGEWQLVLEYFAGFVESSATPESMKQLLEVVAEDLAQNFERHLIDRLVTNEDQAGFRKILLSAIFDGFDEVLDGQVRLDRKFNQALAPTVYLPKATQSSAYAEYVFSRRLTRFAPPKVQLQTLRAFLNEDSSFSWIRVQGPPGSGKSRLLLEMCLEAREHGWHAFFIDLASSPGQLDKWEPAEDTLFILDDCLNTSRSGNAAQILTRLTQRAAEGTLDNKVRLVLASRMTAGWEEFLTSSPETMVDVPSFHFREMEVVGEGEEAVSEAVNRALLERALPMGVRLDHWSDEEANEIAIACLQAFLPLSYEEARYRAYDVVRAYRAAIADKPSLKRTGLPLVMLLCAESLAKYGQLGLPFSIQLLSEILEVQRAKWQHLRDEKLVNLVFLACMLEDIPLSEYSDVYSEIDKGLRALDVRSSTISIEQLLPHPLSLERQTLIDLFGEEERAGKIEPHFIGELFMLSRLGGSFRLLASASAVAEMSGVILAAVFGSPILRGAAFRSLCEATIDLAHHEGAKSVNEALRNFRGVCDLGTYNELLGAIEDVSDEALEDLLMEASLALTDVSLDQQVLETWAFTLIRLVQRGNVVPVLKHIRTPQYLALAWQDQSQSCMRASAPTAPTALKCWVLLDDGIVHDGWEAHPISNPFILGLHSEDAIHWSPRKEAYVLARSILRITVSPKSEAHVQVASMMRNRSFPSAFRGNEWTAYNLDRILGIFYHERENDILVDFEFQGGHQGGASFDEASWRAWLVDSQPMSFYHVRRKDQSRPGGALFNCSHTISLAADGGVLCYLRDRTHYDPAAEEVALAKLLGGPTIKLGLGSRFCRRASLAFKGWSENYYIDYGSTFSHSFESTSQQYEVPAVPLIDALSADSNWIEIGEKWINLDEISALWVNKDEVVFALYSNNRVSVPLDRGRMLAAGLGCHAQLEKLIRRRNA